jgi:ubiquilin
VPDPAVVDQLVAMDPQMQPHAAQLREQNPQLREMLCVLPHFLLV